MISKGSPTSLKVTFRQLREGRNKSLASCFQMEYRITQTMMQKQDFYSGVRSMLITRDMKPQWSPATLEEVTEAMVAEYFQPFEDPNKELVLTPPTYEPKPWIVEIQTPLPTTTDQKATE